MSVIKIPLLYVGSKGEKRLYTLFNCGANLSCINPRYAKELGKATSIGMMRQLNISNENNIEIRELIRLKFYISDLLLSEEFLMVPGLGEEVVIGANTIRKWQIKLDFEHGKALVHPKVPSLQLI